MTNRNPRSLLWVSALLVLLACVAASAEVAMFDPMFRAKLWADRIAALVKENKHAQVEAETQKFIVWLKQHEAKYPKLESFIATAYGQRSTAEAKQGKYLEAANTVRESHAWKPNPANIDLAMKYTMHHMAQSEYYAKAMEFHNKRIELKRQILALVNEKDALIQAALKSKDITKDQLEKLQAQLKALSEKVAALRKEQKELSENYLKETEKYRKDEIVFTAAQNLQIRVKAATAEKLRDTIAKVEERVAQGLLTITEKYKWSWDGLEELLGKMKDLQVKIMDLQKQMLALMEKKPLSDADKKKMLELKAQLDKLLAEQDKLMADLEKAFMDTKTFFKLSPEQQAKYLEMFKTIREAAKVIGETTKKIDAFLKEMMVKYGDLNGDGKIDRLDLAEMLRKYLVPWTPFRKPYDKAADLDGDGKVTWADYNLLKEAVLGDRKTFPVDPENLPGDMDGNGKIDHEDVYQVAKYITDPKSFPECYKKIADVNGDGKVDLKDLTDLISKITTPTAPTGDAAGSGKSAPPATGTGDATGITTGETGTGDAADTLDSAF